jgi:hypothetical protein
VFWLVSNTLARLYAGQFVFATDCHNVQMGQCSTSVQPENTFDFIYMSGGQLFTVGSKYIPITTGAEALQIVIVASGLLLITLTLAVFVGGLKINGPPPMDPES